MCRSGVEGRLCDVCRVGFFGFSSQGCRGAGVYFNTSPLHSAHIEGVSNFLNVSLCSSTCLPRPCAPIPPSFGPPPACNCDPMGSVSMQCHSNGTCQCRQGFVGYKCDKCELNYFHNRATHQCEECPVCYGLVKKQVSLSALWLFCVCQGQSHGFLTQ